MSSPTSRIVAIIPARGGSKGIPRKNIKPFRGRPLIAWSIDDARQAKSVNEVYVSTDDQEIASVARQYGAQALMRPPDLATDTSSSEAALLHALDLLEKNQPPVDLVVFLQATSPVRTSTHVEEALELFHRKKADSLLSVCPAHVFLWEQRDGWGVPLNYDYRHRPMRQQMSQFRENGSIYIFKPAILRETGSRLGGKIALYAMPEACCVDIDTPADWAGAETILEKESCL